MRAIRHKVSHLILVIGDVVSFNNSGATSTGVMVEQVPEDGVDQPPQVRFAQTVPYGCFSPVPVKANFEAVTLAGECPLRFNSMASHLANDDGSIIENPDYEWPVQLQPAPMPEETPAP